MIYTRYTQAFVACVVVLLLISSATRADEMTDIGYVDQAVLADIPSVRSADRQLADYKNRLDTQLATALRTASTPADRQRIEQTFQEKLAERQRVLLEPVLRRAQTAIASIASSKNLSVVVDKRIIIVGGQDITRNAVELITGISDPVPPVNTPPPSRIGFVDQARIDEVPQLKSAMQAFAAFRTDQQQQAQSALQGSKTDADRRHVLENFQKSILAEQKQKLDPLVERTRSAIADVAQKKSLLLVVDRNDVLYGGMDITPEVTKNLGG